MSFEADGYDVISPGLAPAELTALRREFPEGAPNRRNLFVFSPTVEALTRRGSFSRHAQNILGPACFAVRAIFFNKIAKANWHVPWHQDVGIPVRERREAEGFHAFTIKEGIPHVNAPEEVLRGLLILRLHLDDCTARNGAMRLLAGSHTHGRLPEMETTPAEWGHREVQPRMRAGEILRMRPLLMHASAHSVSDAARRVVHIEYAAADLPGGLEWASRVYPESDGTANHELEL
jgi:hypothetical protein